MLSFLRHFLSLFVLVFYRLVFRVCHRHWGYFPLGKTKRASKEHYLHLAEKAKKEILSEVDAYERETGYSISSEWIDHLALHTQVVVKKSPICYGHGRILYSALSNYIKEKRLLGESEQIFILETGTARGFSAVCMAKALEDLNQVGALITIDLLPHKTPKNVC